MKGNQITKIKNNIFNFFFFPTQQKRSSFSISYLCGDLEFWLLLLNEWLGPIKSAEQKKKAFDKWLLEEWEKYRERFQFVVVVVGT